MAADLENLREERRQLNHDYTETVFDRARNNGLLVTTASEAQSYLRDTIKAETDVYREELFSRNTGEILTPQELGSNFRAAHDEIVKQAF